MNYDVELWKKIRKEKKITYAQLAINADMSVRALIGIFNQEEKYKNPTAATIQAIEIALGINRVQDKYFPSENITIFEVIGNVTAGYDGIIQEEFTGDVQEVPSSLLKGHDYNDFFVLNVKGNSMYPQFLDGDKVLVERCSSVDSETVAVVLYNDEEVTIKKVHYIKGQNWLELIPRNPEYPVKRIENEDLERCRVLGKVVYLFRKI